MNYTTDSCIPTYMNTHTHTLISLLSLSLSMGAEVEASGDQSGNEDAISLSDIIPETNICFVSLALSFSSSSS